MALLTAVHERHPKLFFSRPATAALALAVGVAWLAVSALTYRVIERPFLARKARLNR